MIISQISMTLPKVMSRYLLMMAAMTSVPPVLPLAQNATPIPPPQNDAPMTHAMKGWSRRRETPDASCWITDRKKVRVNTPKIVLIQNFNPNNLSASNNKKKVNAEICILYRESRCPIYNRCDTRHSARRNVVGE